MSTLRNVKYAYRATKFLDDNRYIAFPDNLEFFANKLPLNEEDGSVERAKRSMALLLLTMINGNKEQFKDSTYIDIFQAVTDRIIRILRYEVTEKWGNVDLADSENLNCAHTPRSTTLFRLAMHNRCVDVLDELDTTSRPFARSEVIKELQRFAWQTSTVWKLFVAFNFSERKVFEDTIHEIAQIWPHNTEF